MTLAVQENRLAAETLQGTVSLTGEGLLWLLVPGLLLIDIANGLLGEGSGIGGLPITPGEVVRGALFAVGLFLLATKRGPLIDRLRRWLVLLALLGALGPLRGLVVGGSLSHVLFDVEKLFKTMYGPVLVGLYAILITTMGVRLPAVFRAMAGFGALAGVAVIGFKLLGLGAETYRAGLSLAHKGFFLAQNDLGLSMIIALAAATHLAFRRGRALYWIAAALTGTGLLVLGTRAATLGTLLVPLVVAAINYRKYVTDRRLPLAVVLGMVLVALVGAIGVGRFGQIAAEPYQLRKYQRLLGGELTRVILLAGAVAYVTNRPVTATFVGDGANRYQRGVAQRLGGFEERSLAEVDWMDIFGAHGAAFLLTLLAFYGVLVLDARSLKLPHGRAGAYGVIFCVLLYLGHALLAGHALSGPLPTGVVAPLLGYVWSQRCRAPVLRAVSHPGPPAPGPEAAAR